MSKLGTMIAVSFSIAAATTNQISRSVITASGSVMSFRSGLTIVLSSPNTTAASTSAPGEPIVMSGKATRMARTIALATKDQKSDSTRHTVARFYAAAFAMAVAAAVALAPPAAAAADPATQLADRYAPVVRVVAQEKECGHGEPYTPIDVNAVLRNPDVALRGGWAGGQIVEVGPTGGDLGKGLTGYHLDFPGNALDPACDYEKWSHAITEGTKPTSYARVVTDPDHPGKLALQYWFFYAFNDWNNTHEGDWEMIQLDFDAADAAAALKTDPYEVGYSQHTGGERAAWGSSKLKLLDGTHPVVYSALGSHANYFSSQLFLGRSGPQGVGCDDTLGPSRDIRPVVALVPTAKDAYLHEYPWLGFLGHWGEEHSGFYNGPTGPNTKSQWTNPITWADTTWRGDAYAVPAGGTVGTSATDFFCGAVARGSNLLTAAVANPPRIFVVIGAIVLLLLWLASRTRWDVSAPFRIARRRPWGSLITSSFSLYWSRKWLFLGIGVVFLPLGVLITVIQYLLFRVGGLSALTDSAGASNAFVAALALALGLFFTIIGLTLVQAVTALAMVQLDEGHDVGPLDAYRLVLPRLRRLIGALLRAAVVIAVLDLTVAGLFISAWLLFRWVLIPQVVALEEPTRRPLRRSAALTRGHWWFVASITVVMTGGGLALGPVIGALLLLVTTASFNVINVIAAVVYVFALPLAAITQTYLYFDLRVEEKLVPAEAVATAVLPAEL